MQKVARLIRACRRAAVVFVVAAWLVAWPVFAFAFDEPNNLPEDHTSLGSDPTTCERCHAAGAGGLAYGCTMCHMNVDVTRGKGPHGLYSDATSRCDMCHGVHAAAGPNLLYRTTTTDSCNVCHDGTGGRGVYGTVSARTGVAPAAMHRIDTTSVVPGGDAATGGDATMAFRGENGTLGCADCHSPHDANTIAPFRLERWRSSYDTIAYRGYQGNQLLGITTNRLLRSHPGDSPTEVTVYGSDWCVACHAGRAARTPLHNHPVDSTLSTSTPFTYVNLAVLASDDPTSATVLGGLAYSNRGYLIPYPRTTGATGQNEHDPICQQCHEDARNVGELTGAGNIGDAAAFVITARDGLAAGDNPRFQNFPHETLNPYMLAETEDDLCTNCHPTGPLP